MAKCVEAADKIVAAFEPAIAEARAKGERIGRERERAEIVADYRQNGPVSCGCCDESAAEWISRIERADHIEARAADPAPALDT